MKVLVHKNLRIIQGQMARQLQSNLMLSKKMSVKLLQIEPKTNKSRLKKCSSNKIKPKKLQKQLALKLKRTMVVSSPNFSSASSVPAPFHELSSWEDTHPRCIRVWVRASTTSERFGKGNSLEDSWTRLVSSSCPFWKKASGRRRITTLGATSYTSGSRLKQSWPNSQISQ